MADPKWKRFECLVARVQHSLAPTASVLQDQKIVGRNTGTPRQVDIVVRQQVGQYELIIAIDCKDYAQPVDVKDVEMFAGLLDDVGANKGAIVATNGFSETAKILAGRKGIDLYGVIDAEDHEWRRYVSLPTVVSVRTLSWSLTFEGAAPLRDAIPEDTRTLVLFDATGQPLNCVHNLIGALWEGGDISDEPGEYRGLPLASVPTYIKFKGHYAGIRVTANATVRQEFYFGQLPVESTEGFSDEISGSMVTRRLETGGLNLADVTKTWQRLADRSELSVDPVLEFGCKVAHEPIPIEEWAG